MEWLIWIGIIAGIAALLVWLFTKGSSSGAAPLPAERDGRSPDAAPPATSTRSDNLPPAAGEEPEPIDGWTESAAETAHYDPATEDAYIEDLPAEDRDKPPLYDGTEWGPHTGEAVVEPRVDPVDGEEHGRRAG
jgi:hypothetical protein